MILTCPFANVDLKNNCSIAYAAANKVALGRDNIHWARSYRENGFTDDSAAITRFVPNVASSTPFTFYFRGQLITRPSSGYAGFFSDNSSQGIVMNASGNVEFQLAAGVRLSSSNTLAAGDYFDIVAYGNNSGTNNYNVIVNGVTTTASASWGCFFWPEKIGYFTGWRTIGADLSVFAYWPTVLPLEQINALLLDPYDTLEDSQEWGVFFPAGTGGGGFNAAWAKNANVLLGGARLNA